MAQMIAYIRLRNAGLGYNKYAGVKRDNWNLYLLLLVQKNNLYNVLCHITGLWSYHLHP